MCVCVWYRLECTHYVQFLRTSISVYVCTDFVGIKAVCKEGADQPSKSCVCWNSFFVLSL